MQDDFVKVLVDVAKKMKGKLRNEGKNKSQGQGKIRKQVPKQIKGKLRN